jgi:hypothetical protein
LTEDELASLTANLDSKFPSYDTGYQIDDETLAFFSQDHILYGIPFDKR